MADIEIDDRAMRQYAADLARVDGRFRPLVNQALRKAGADVVADAKLASPYKTGNLKNSISASPVTEAGGGFSIEVGPTASYGVFLELGTSRMAPRPFLFPAADAHAPLLAQAIGELAERSLP